MSDRRLLTAILRTDLSSFIQKVFVTVSPGDEYLHGWHVDAVAWHLQRCLSGEINRLIITMPPRHLKSISASVAFPAYILGQDPKQRIVSVSYSQDLAIKHARDCRAVIESDWYRRTFPRTRIDRDKNSHSEFATTHRGFRLATSVGGTLTGRGGKIVVLDDVHKPDEAPSESSRNAVIDWFRNTLLSRLDDKARDVIIVVQQRVHERDLVGVLLDQGGWTHLNLPAVAEEPQVIPFASNLAQVREVDDVLHPAREPYDKLMELKSQMGSYVFAAQYQQSPAPLGGGIVKIDWFRRYDDPPERRLGDIVVQSWDTASKAAEINDYSVCTTWLVRGNTFYMLHVLRKRLEYPDLRRCVLELRLAHQVDEVLIEDKGSGTQLIQDLQEQRVYPRAITPEGDKLIRMMTQTAPMEAGRVHIPLSAPWLEDFLDELAKFPAARFDDQVDSLSQFLKWATGPKPPEPRIRWL
jgi:predicted phage terminase large subunit-like protein